MDFLKINDKTLPAPVKYDISKIDIEGENSMSETGVLHRSIVRSGVYSIDAVWRVSDDDLKNILGLISKVSFDAVFLDPDSSSEKVRTMYAAEKSYSCIGFDGGKSWWNLSVRFFEF